MTETVMRQRWRAVEVEWRSWLVARIKDQRTGKLVGVYHRLGRWRYFGSDEPVHDRALAACARRAIQAADFEQCHAEARRRIKEQAAKLDTGKGVRRG